MAGTPTTHYNFPTYADDDTPALTGAYNSAVAMIDSQFYTQETDQLTNESRISVLESKVEGLEGGGFAPTESDLELTVSNLAGLKVTSSGVVYLPKEGE